MKETEFNYSTGLNLDSSFNEYPNDAYYNAENVRPVIGKDLRSVVLKGASGNVLKYTIDSGYKVHGYCSVGDKTVIFGIKSTKTESVDHSFDDKIYVGTITNETGSESLTTWFSGQLNFSIDYPIKDTIGRIESNTIEKVYWVDGLNQLRLANIAVAAPVLTSSFDIVPLVSLGSNFSTTLNDFGIGQLKCGKVQYAYQLFNLNGQESSFSNPTRLIPLVPISEKDVDTSGKIQGGNNGENSGKSITLTLTNIPSGYSYIRIVRIFYTDLLSDPTIENIYETTFSSTLKFIDYGTNLISTYTLSEFRVINNLFYPKTLATKNNTLFSANLTEVQYNPDYDARAYRFDSGRYARLYNESDTPSVNNPVVINGTSPNYSVSETHDCLNSYNLLEYDAVVDANVFYNDYIYQANGATVGGEGVNVKYQFYINAMSFTPYNPSFPTNSLDCPKVSGTFSNYSSIYNNFIKGSHQRDEIYRYGIVLINYAMQPSPVKWIGDIRIPTTTAHTTYTGGNIVLNSIDVLFTISNLPSDCMGYQIVRVKRDSTNRTVIDTGIAGHAVSRLVNSYLYPTEISLHKSVPSVPKLLTSSASLPGYEGTDLLCYSSPNLVYNTESFENCDRIDFLYDLNQGIPDATSVPNNIPYTFGDIYSPYHFYANVGRYGSYFDDIYPLCVTPAYTNNTIRTINRLTVNSETTVQAINTNTFYKKGVSALTEIDYLKNLGGTKTFGNYTLRAETVHSKINVAQNIYNASDYAYTPTSLWTFWNYKDPAAAPTISFFDGVYVGNCGKKLFMLLDSEFTDVPSSGGVQVNNGVYALRRKIARIYGGYSYTARQFNIYESCSEFKSKSEVTNYVHGDTYITLHEDLTSYGVMDANNLADGNQTTDEIALSVTAYYFVESEKNLEFSNGYKHGKYEGRLRGSSSEYSPVGSEDFVKTFPFVREKAGTYLCPTTVGMDSYSTFNQDKDLYVYNEAYSRTSDSKIFLPETSLYQEETEFKGRIKYSNRKINGELVDSWTKFLPNNFLDLPIDFGEITSLVNSNNKLISFQDNAIAYLSVEEREAIQSSSGTGSLVLGTGGILSRFDYISVNSGCIYEDRFSITTTNDTVYWFDRNNNVFYRYDNDDIPLSKIKGVNTLLKGFRENISKVIGGYNKLYNEVCFTIVPISGTYKTVAYNELLNQFTTFFTFNPDVYMLAGKNFLTSSGRFVYIHNSGNIGSFMGTTSPIKVSIMLSPKTVDIHRLDAIELFTLVTNASNEELNKTFTEYTITNSYQTVTKDISSLSTADIRRFIRTWRINNFRNNADGKRFYDSYHRIELSYTPSSGENLVIYQTKVLSS